MNIFAKAISITLVMLSISLTADAGTSIMRISESVKLVSVYLPAKLQVSNRGSVQDQIQSLIDAPGLEIKAKDMQRISETVSVISGGGRDGCKQNIVDGLVRIYWQDGHVDDYILSGSSLVKANSETCFSIPEWISKSLLI